MGNEEERKRENSSSNASFSIGHLLCTGHCARLWTLQGNNLYFLRRVHCPGAWVAQLVKHPALHFSSGHGLMVHEFEPRIVLCADSSEAAWDSLSPSRSLSLSLSLSQNQINIFF